MQGFGEIRKGGEKAMKRKISLLVVALFSVLAVRADDSMSLLEFLGLVYQPTEPIAYIERGSIEYMQDLQKKFKKYIVMDNNVSEAEISRNPLMESLGREMIGYVSKMNNQPEGSVIICHLSKNRMFFIRYYPRGSDNAYSLIMQENDGIKKIYDDILRKGGVLE